MLNAQNLAYFSGTEQYYRHVISHSIVHTDGVHYVMNNGAGWLVDAIYSWQFEEKVALEPFQTWTLKVADEKGILSATDGNGNTIAEQKIEYTDFPLPEIKFFVSDNVLMLASEY